MLINYRAYQFARPPTDSTTDNRDNMAATKTIEDFPGAYSGQGRSWERMDSNIVCGLHKEIR